MKLRAACLKKNAKPLARLIKNKTKCKSLSYVWLFAILCTIYNPPGSSVHGILQGRIQEWVVIPFSRVSSQPRDQTRISHIAGTFFTTWATNSSYQGKKKKEKVAIKKKERAQINKTWNENKDCYHCLLHMVGCHSRALFQMCKFLHPLSHLCLWRIKKKRSKREEVKTDTIEIQNEMTINNYITIKWTNYKKWINS